MLYYRIVINGTGTAGGEIVYTDTLPENTTLVTDSWTHGGKTYQDGKSSFHGVMIRYQELGTTTEKTYGVDDKEATEEGVTVTQENGVLKVTIPESAYKKDTTIDEVILYYALRVNLPENTITSENPTITLTNIGSATCTEDSGTDGATATIQTPNLTKEAGTYQDQTIKYTLTIEEKSEIDPSNDTGEFTVKDTLTYPSTPEKAGDNYITGVSVVPGSAKLYYYDESGEQIYLDSDKISFPDNQTSGSCTIYGYVPYTGMTYYMEYTYLFEFANTKNLEGTLTNEAYVEGQESDVWEDSTNTAFVQEFSSSTARTDNTKLQLVKVEKGNYAKVLEGAVYRLEMWDGSKWTYINRFTTDSNGVVELGEQNGQGEYFIRYNYLYRLEELTAPENHKAAEGYSYIYVDGGKSNNTPNLPENFDSLDILSITNDTYVYVEDEKTAVGEIKVEKRWEDEEGETLPDSEKRPITVKLWQSTSKETNTADTENGTPYAEQVLNDANGWEYTFEELPLKVNDQNVYYFVTEVMSENTQSAGNASSTSYVYETEIDATEGITNGTIMIKNVKTQITPIPSPEQTPTNSPTPTPVATPTNSPTPTPTSSPTPTDTPIPTPTDTPVPTPTDTPVPTPTDTPVPTPTDTPVPTPTDTPIPTPTDTPVPTPTDTPVPTPTDTPVPTPTDTPVPTPTDTPVPTPTDTPVPTPTDTPVATPTDTPVPTPTDTPVPTPTETPVATPTDTPVPTPTDTPVPTPTETPAPTPTDTPEKITISGKKTWNGLSIKQPQSITIRLYADGEEIATATASDTNDYTYSFADLDKYNEGLEIDYEIQEDPVPGYVTTYDGYDVENTLTTVKISKVDVTGGEELEGAHIQILDKEGSLVEEWDSTTQPHEIHGLLTGEEYTLRETVAPEGYTITTDTTFTLKEDGTIDEDKSSTHVSEEGTLLVEDDKTRVSIVKQNEEGTQIEGARLEIVDPDSNKVVTTWITDGKAHDVTGLLLAGKTYNLREVSAPSGYLLSEDVEFIVPEKGTDNPIVVQMTDRNASEGLGSISVTKQIVTFDTDLMEFLDITANDSTFYVGLFTDAEGRHPYGTPKAIRIQNASSGSATFTDLPDGTYYVFETDAEGNPIPYDDLEDGYEFYCTLVDEETNVVEINTKSKELEGKVNLTNVYSDWPDGYSLRGDLAVSKVVLSEETTIEVDDIFYVGVFSDQELETADVAVAQLSNNGTIHIEVPITGDGKTTQVFWIFETDAEGHRISGTEGFAYEVSGEDMVSLDTLENGLNQEITLTNTLITEEAAPTPTPTTAPTPTPTTAPTATPTAVPTATPAPKTDVPKTGDSSNAEWYLLLLAGAFIGMGASIYGKKRREK
jgi:LPXTG-motif cell wall-anchored protein